MAALSIVRKNSLWELPPHLCQGPLYSYVKEGDTALIPLFSTSIQLYHTQCGHGKGGSLVSGVSLDKKCNRRVSGMW